jgi:membrane-associated phospholipid phosphatase
MNVEGGFETVLARDVTVVPPGWDECLARRVSQLSNPPLLALGGMLLAVHAVAAPTAWLWAAVYMALTVVTPLSYLLWLVKKGEVTDLDVQLREQRGRPLVAALAGAAAAWLILWFGTAPDLMVLLAGASWLLMALLLGITLRWKISIHCAAAAGIAVLAWEIAGGTIVPLALGVSLVAWSRIRLRRHTLGQAVAGLLLGGAVFLIALFIGR